MRALGITAASLFLTSIAPTTAFAGGFGEKTMRYPLSTSEVERSLILPRGWIETQVDFEQKVATAAFDGDGNRVDFEHSTWTYRTERITLSMGYGSKSELWFSIPVHQARLTQDREGVAAEDQVNIPDSSVGDPKVGWKLELLKSEAPLTSVIFDTWWKGPAGSEAPGTFIGGPLNVQNFVFTTGSPDAYFGLAGKRQFGPAAVTLRAGYKHRFSATVQYLIELENLQFLGRISPGNEFLVDVDAHLQLGPLVVYAGTRGKARGETRIGTTSGGVRPDVNCSTGTTGGCMNPVIGSGGSELDAVFGVEVIASRGLELTVGARVPWVGEDLMFFPIEDLHPTAGTTINASLEVRY